MHVLIARSWIIYGRGKANGAVRQSPASLLYDSGPDNGYLGAWVRTAVLPCIRKVAGQEGEEGAAWRGRGTPGSEF